MHIQRICGQSRLVTHCSGRLSIYLTSTRGVGTWKSARVERSLLESGATGERAVRLATLSLAAHLLDLMTLLRIEMALRPFSIFPAISSFLAVRLFI